jgi:hypothetical protein
LVTGREEEDEEDGSEEEEDDDEATAAAMEVDDLPFPLATLRAGAGVEERLREAVEEPGVDEGGLMDGSVLRGATPFDMMGRCST